MVNFVHNRLARDSPEDLRLCARCSNRRTSTPGPGYSCFDTLGLTLCAVRGMAAPPWFRSWAGLRHSEGRRLCSSGPGPLPVSHARNRFCRSFHLARCPILLFRDPDNLVADLQLDAIQRQRDLSVGPGIPRRDTDGDEMRSICFRDNRTILAEEAGNRVRSQTWHR